ncbi:MAG: helix-turn-helix transcriptional regulator [Oscillospiraceae bacterium]|nr:helix-turn-helix transcriptional regulator [Oscillospiraceae bacterium]
MSLAENIKTIRESRGLSQSELAEKIQLQKQNVSAYERGVKIPTVEKLAALADALHCTTDRLLGRDVS